MLYLENVLCFKFIATEFVFFSCFHEKFSPSLRYRPFILQ